MGNLLNTVLRRSDDIQDEGTEGNNLLLELYATQTLDFSSQYGSDRSFSYTANNCLGIPTKFPNYGDFPQTFVMRTFGDWSEKSPGGIFLGQIRCKEDLSQRRSLEFIDLRFDHSVFVHGVYIYETLNPGSIVSIWAGDCKGRWQCLWSGEPVRVGHQPRQFGPPIEPASFSVNQIRLIFDCHDLPYHAAVDAVCLLGTLQRPPDSVGPILRYVTQRRIQAKSFKDDSLDNDRRSPDNGFFDFIPREAVLHIFKHLDFLSLVQCSQVSKLFRQVACDPMLYVRLELPSFFHIVSNQTLKFALPRCQLLRYLDLTRCGNYGKITPVTLRTFMYARGSRLTNLILRNCHVATKTVLIAVSKTCNQLVDLDLGNCHILDTGHFGCLSRICTLQHLNLYRTQVSNSELKRIIKSNPRLLNLRIGSCSRIIGDDICNWLSLHCPNLQNLDMWRCDSVTARGVLSLGKLKHLQDLDLGWCVNILASTGCIQTLVTQCRSLSRLLLTAHRQTSDSDIDTVSSLEHLTQFSCMGSRNISTESILRLGSKCSKLKLLDISYCENLENYAFHRDLCTLLPECHVVTSLNGS